MPPPPNYFSNHPLQGSNKMVNFFSIIPLIDAYIRRSFTAASLVQSSISIDSETTIRYWMTNPQNPSPNPQTLLVLIHGFGPSATWQWRQQVGPLSRHFRLLVPDLLFFGGSYTSSPRRSELFQAESILKLIDKICGNDEKFCVLGTSYGGFVAYHVARMSPERVLRAVIASSDVLKGKEDDRMLKERAGVESVVELMLPRSTATLRKLIGLAVYKEPRFLPEFVLRDAVKNLYNEKLKEKTELIKGITLGNKDEFQITPLPMDVLIIWGEHDRIFPLNKAFELQKQLGEKAKLEIVKNTGHVPNAEAPYRFNKVLLEFLLDDSKPSA